MKRFLFLFLFLAVSSAHAATLVIRKTNGAQINVTPTGGITAVSDAGAITLGSATNMTLTTPRIDAIHGTNGERLVLLTDTASADNYLDFRNATTGNAVTITTGGDVNAPLTISPAGYLQLISNGSVGAVTNVNVELGHATDTTLSRLGAGRMGVEGIEVLTQTNTLTGITNKTFTSPVLMSPTIGDGSGATAILASNLSGATDPTITFGNNAVTIGSGNLIVSSTGGNTFGDLGTSIGRDVIVGRTLYLNSAQTTLLDDEAAAIIQQGADASGDTVDQVYKAADSTGANGIGSDLTFRAGDGNGTGAGGSLIFQTAPASGTFTTALTIDSTQAATFAGVSTFTGATTHNGGAISKAGTGSATAKIGGTLKVDTTDTGNVGTGEDNLISYTIPAAVLGADGDYLEFDVYGTIANSVNNKTIKVHFGSTVIFNTGALSGATLGANEWRAHGRIIRTGAATQDAICEFTLQGALLGAVTTTTIDYTSPTETLSGTVAFKCTGEATADNEVIQKGMVLKWYPAQ